MVSRKGRFDIRGEAMTGQGLYTYGKDRTGKLYGLVQWAKMDNGCATVSKDR
jgi:hypothetical protein